ncbi:hypothetical protein [Agromyces ramosus]|uniref:hypothetical protein n=1 Tax=Agromyces ramosus TaxID=33879 RepID=UPI00102AC453|nr:hypothetical protein [Agromyces ramosus]
MPDDPLGEPIDEMAELALVAVAAAVTAPIGGIGGLLVEGVIAWHNNISMRKWIAAADAALEAHGRRLDPDDPLAIAAFNRFTIGALQTTRQEKREYLAEALANCGSNRPTPDFLQEMFADAAVRYSVEHVTLLYIAAEPAQWLSQVGRDLADINRDFAAVLPGSVFEGIDEWELLFDTIWTDLYNDGMIMNRPGPGMNLGGLRPMVTTKGRRFLRFLGREAEM